MKSIEILLPYCSLENEPDQIRITLKANIIARAASIFKVERITLYRSRSDKKSCKDQKEILGLLLRYFVTPPYLKKKIFGKRKELKYVGMAYPLQIPTHSLSKKAKEGDIRVGLVERVKESAIFADIGVGKQVKISNSNYELKRGDLIFVKVKKGDLSELEIIKNPDIYVGYSVRECENPLDYLKEKKKEGLIIGTSKFGDPIWENLKEVEEKLKSSDKVVVVFGEPYRGIFEIFKQLGGNTDDLFHGIYNLVRDQGTKTIRMEEALFIALSLLNVLSS
ncbi:hypothetical protein IOK49_03415 [Fervidicoccus fontis]|uniref:RNA-binding protein n=1 Tax=Fervidicoccus fontis TaxID=683846 RepID=A0A2J6N9V6_9CREN|nr:RNA methyltransferase [Fervidicoccus fontis]MBE9391127.1 hypothetical protein [Fervidicoccus fontis]PMB75739.1 MAG: hypothetical protein C0188_01975 [Fervidicoccus fontis]PMB78125.1 MAG: hypothetical protein C0177_00945 [Fervidicoccus fontis]HEW64191.1 hypothetical protein [Fervidicoccus fontis]